MKRRRGEAMQSFVHFLFCPYQRLFTVRCFKYVIHFYRKPITYTYTLFPVRELYCREYCRIYRSIFHFMALTEKIAG